MPAAAAAAHTPPVIKPGRTGERGQNESRLGERTGWGEVGVRGGSMREFRSGERERERESFLAKTLWGPRISARDALDRRISSSFRYF